MDNSTLNRRRFPRTDHSYTISFRRSDIDDANWDISSTKNLSLGGAFFLSGECFRDGATLEIKLNIPSRPTHCECQGMVQRCRGPFKNAFYKTAVRFTGIDENYAASLRESINFFLGRET